MNQDQVLSAARSLFKLLGAYLVTKGIGDSSGWEEIGGAVAVVVGILWSWFHHADSKTPEPSK